MAKQFGMLGTYRHGHHVLHAGARASAAAAAMMMASMHAHGQIPVRRRQRRTQRGRVQAHVLVIVMHVRVIVSVHGMVNQFCFGQSRLHSVNGHLMGPRATHQHWVRCGVRVRPFRQVIYI